MIAGILLCALSAGALAKSHSPAKKTVAPTSANKAKAPVKKPLAAAKRSPKAAPAKSVAKTSVSTRAQGAKVKTVKLTAKRRVRRGPAERFTASSFAQDNLYANDVTAGEDPIVRQAAIDAMGSMNGTAVVINASTGRILAMINQKLALSPGAEPCSTIKITVAMAALSEGLVTRETPVQLSGFRMNMTQALAKSNNLYFEELGRQLGFERVRRYATEFGLGELAGLNIEGEQLGIYPNEPISASRGGVGRMCSFGEGISLTPLQLGAYVAALANGGTLYYLQHPTSQEQLTAFEPKIKRTLDIAKFIPEMQEGMAGAVEFGTARSLRANFREFPVFGKTGTCSDKGTRFGWFASFTETPQGRLATVFFLEGGRPTFGPRAAELTGIFYKNLKERNYFGAQEPELASSSTPVQTDGTQTLAR